MSEASDKERARRARLRWVTLGEAIAISALIISGLGLWMDWKSGQQEAPSKPETVIEERKPIPLRLHGMVEDEGKRILISPIEDSHALDSMIVTVRGGDAPIRVGSDGVLKASEVEDAVGKPDGDADGVQRAPLSIETRYVEAGQDRTSTGNYMLSYRWEGGGLFGGRSLRITGMSRG